MAVKIVLFFLSYGGAVLFLFDLYESNISTLAKGYFTFCAILAAYLVWGAINDL